MQTLNRIVCLGALTCVLAGGLYRGAIAQADEAEPRFVVSSGDFTCGDGMRLASVSFAQTHIEELCNSLEDWDAVRLAGRASLSGPGGNCAIRKADSRRLLKSACVPKADSGAIRGVLLLGGFRTQQELNATSPQDWRDALSLEISNRLAEPITTFEALSDMELSAAGGMLVLLQSSSQFDAISISKFTLAEARLKARELLSAQTGIPLGDLLEMTDEEIFELIWKG